MGVVVMGFWRHSGARTSRGIGENPLNHGVCVERVVTDRWTTLASRAHLAAVTKGELK
jgi:hypothetical protein